MNISRISGLGVNIQKNTAEKQPFKSFYDLKAVLIGGETFDFENLRNKQVLIVNIAGLCGYTPQLSELQQLFQNNKNLQVLAFPSNDFRNQEPGSNEEIANFCRTRFGITFSLFEKSHVTGPQKNEVFRWLTFESENGWNHLEPGWNFWKYVVDEAGVLQVVASAAVSPEVAVDEL